MEPCIQTLVTVVVTVLASGGFWSFLQYRSERTNNWNKLTLGLAHDRIVCLSDKYVARGYITRDEYENLHDYLYLPYHACHGNGTGDKAMKQVDALPMHDYPIDK